MKAVKVAAALVLSATGTILTVSGQVDAACSQSTGTTVVDADVGNGRVVQLRWNQSTNCVWGRIINANSGDQVKAQVENVATTSTITVGSGSTSAYTGALDRGDHRARAWGKHERGIYPDYTKWTAYWP